MAFISPLGLLRISPENGEAHIKPQGRTAARSRITLGDFGRIELPSVLSLINGKWPL
jgi:hypothetical protein